MNVTGIVFTNDASLGELTTKRTMASLPFGGRYRQVDWALSNLACAGVRHIGIISRHNYQSLMNHIGDGEEWGLELEEGGLEFLTPYAQSEVHRYRGKLESLASAMDFLAYGSDDELVIMTDSAILSNIDLTKVIAAHVKSGRNITVVTKAGICNGEKMIDLAMKLDGKGNVTDMLVDFAAPADYVASMDIFVVDKKWLMQQTREMIARDKFHMDRDLVLGGWQRGKVSPSTAPPCTTSPWRNISKTPWPSSTGTSATTCSAAIIPSTPRFVTGFPPTTARNARSPTVWRPTAVCWRATSRKAFCSGRSPSPRARTWKTASS